MDITRIILTRYAKGVWTFAAFAFRNSFRDIFYLEGR